MKILFVHQNFPGQFKFLAPALAAQGHEVVAMTMQKVTQETWNGVRLVPYAPSRGSTAGVHPWVSDFETKVIRGDACFRAAMRMRPVLQLKLLWIWENSSAALKWVEAEKQREI